MSGKWWLWMGIRLRSRDAIVESRASAKRGPCPRLFHSNAGRLLYNRRIMQKRKPRVRYGVLGFACPVDDHLPRSRLLRHRRAPTSSSEFGLTTAEGPPLHRLRARLCRLRGAQRLARRRLRAEQDADPHRPLVVRLHRPHGGSSIPATTSPNSASRFSVSFCPCSSCVSCSAMGEAGAYPNIARAFTTGFRSRNAAPPRGPLDGRPIRGRHRAFLVWLLMTRRQKRWAAAPWRSTRTGGILPHLRRRSAFCGVSSFNLVPRPAGADGRRQRGGTGVDPWRRPGRASGPACPRSRGKRCSAAAISGSCARCTFVLPMAGTSTSPIARATSSPITMASKKARNVLGRILGVRAHDRSALLLGVCRVLPRWCFHRFLHRPHRQSKVGPAPVRASWATAWRLSVTVVAYLYAANSVWLFVGAGRLDRPAASGMT